MLARLLCADVVTLNFPMGGKLVSTSYVGGRYTSRVEMASVIRRATTTAVEPHYYSSRSRSYAGR